MSKSDELSCPKCNTIMEKGYISPQGFINWSNNDYPNPHPEDEKIVKIKMSLKLDKKEAYRCQGCKVVVFKYD